MFDRLAPDQYRLTKLIHLAVGFLVLGAGVCLVFGWPLSQHTVVWGHTLREWGKGLAFAALINVLVVLVRSLLQPGFKPTWWS